MAADQAVEMAEQAPEASERGRYAVFVTPDGGWVIATAGPLCDRCQGCGCGEAYRDPLPVPAMVVGLMTGQSSLPAPLAKALGKVMGNGRG